MWKLQQRVQACATCWPHETEVGKLGPFSQNNCPPLLYNLLQISRNDDLIYSQHCSGEEKAHHQDAQPRVDLVGYFQVNGRD